MEEAKQLQFFIKDTENAKTSFLQMKIKLNSWSPWVFKNNVKYREKLALDVFSDQYPLQTAGINSYLDHKMSIEHLLASTKNNSLQIKEEGEEIIAKIKIEEDAAPLLKKTADLVKQGILESNSFIFIASENDIKITQTAEDSFEVVYQKGKLLSIDPVYQGFYPQNSLSVYSENNKNFDVLKLIEKQKKENIQIMEKNTDKTDQKPNIQPEDIFSKFFEYQEKNTEILANISQKLEEINKSNKTQTNPQPNLNSFTNQNPTPQNSYEVLLKKALQNNINDSEKFELFKLNYLNQDLPEQTRIKQVYPDFIAQIRDYQSRALDGSSKINGLAVIQTFQQPEILAQVQKQFPEFSQLSQHIPLTALNEIEQLIYLEDTTQINEIAEGADATSFGGRTIALKLQPKRRAVSLLINKALPHLPELWEKQTINAQNQIIASIRKQFYESLFANAGAVLNTDTYSGGPTAEAKVLSLLQNQLSWRDFDKIIDFFKDQNQENNEDSWVFVMHPVTWFSLINPYLIDKNAVFMPQMLDLVGKRYRGVKIITTEFFPRTTLQDPGIIAKAKQALTRLFPQEDASKFTDVYIKENTNYALQGTRPVIFFNTKNLLAYGLDFVIENNPFNEMKKGFEQRFITTRGQMKLADPYIFTRFIEIRG